MESDFRARAPAVGFLHRSQLAGRKVGIGDSHPVAERGDLLFEGQVRDLLRICGKIKERGIS